MNVYHGYHMISWCVFWISFDIFSDMFDHTESGPLDAKDHELIPGPPPLRPEPEINRQVGEVPQLGSTLIVRIYASLCHSSFLVRASRWFESRSGSSWNMHHWSWGRCIMGGEECLPVMELLERYWMNHWMIEMIEIVDGDNQIPLPLCKEKAAWLQSVNHIFL